MSVDSSLSVAHPAGDSHATRDSSNLDARWPVDTPGGRFYAEFDPKTPATAQGQMVFFAQFLHSGGLYKRLQEAFPLEYVGNRGSGKVNVLGTAILGILNGHWRYSHINSVRGDTVNGALLGVENLVSEDVIRAAMKRVDETACLKVLLKEQLHSIYPMLGMPWILDVDTTVKSLYGKQEESEVGYNPHKPGRPSHAYHSYFIANIRLCLGVDVLNGKKSASKHGMDGLKEILDALPPTHWPTFVRGDCGYGNDAIMDELEAVGMPYIFKLPKGQMVKDLIARSFLEGASWAKTADGWEVMESKIKLKSWKKTRRVILVREQGALAPEKMGRGKRTNHPDLFDTQTIKECTQGAPWSGKIAVIVTSLQEKDGWHPEAIAKLYRERAASENIHDELKNQWGWNGFATRNISATRIMANLVALVYNWWTLWIRMFDENHHREAISSRPTLLSGVGSLTRHAGQRTIRVSLQHERAEEIARCVTFNSNFLHWFNAITERWPPDDKWATLLTRIFRKFLGGKRLANVPHAAEPLLAG